MGYDIYLVGVGGQGILTIGEILAEAVRQAGIPVNFFPSKGMAQRGGFVKAQLRLGRANAGPNLPEKGADLVIAMELSEALKAVRFVRPGGDFLLLEERWLPMAVILKKAEYPETEKIREQIRLAQAKLHSVDLASIPAYEGTPVPPNLYLLGAALRSTPLGEIVDQEHVLKVVQERWHKAAERNRFAFLAGYEADLHPIEGAR